MTQQILFVGYAMSLREEVAKRVQLDRNGFGFCPCHDEQTKSFHVFLATRGKHKGEWLFNCFGCGFKGDAADWQEFITGRKGKIQQEDPEVRRIRLANERVRKERDRLERLFRIRYPDTPDEAFGFLETVQIRLKAARLGR